MPSQIRYANDRKLRMHKHTEKKATDRKKKRKVLECPAYIFHRIVLCVLGEILFDAQQDTDAFRVSNNTNDNNNYRKQNETRGDTKKKQRKTSARKKHVQLNSAYIAITKERKLSYSKWTTKRRVKKKNERKTTMPNDCSVWVCEIANIFPSSPLSRTQSENSFVHQIIKSFASLPLQSENSI